MEEVIAKSVRSMYLVVYPILFAMGCLIITLGAFNVALDTSDVASFGWFFVVLGGVIALLCVGYFIYFLKMPPVAIKLKDGKLYFRNGVVCTPTELTDFKAKAMGVDGSIFGFGNLMFTVNGKAYKIRFVDKANDVVKKLFLLKAEYSVKEHIATEQQNTAEENIQEESNG